MRARTGEPWGRGCPPPNPAPAPPTSGGWEPGPCEQPGPRKRGKASGPLGNNGALPRGLGARPPPRDPPQTLGALASAQPRPARPAQAPVASPRGAEESPRWGRRLRRRRGACGSGWGSAATHEQGNGGGGRVCWRAMRRRGRGLNPTVLQMLELVHYSGLRGARWGGETICDQRGGDQKPAPAVNRSLGTHARAAPNRIECAPSARPLAPPTCLLQRGGGGGSGGAGPWGAGCRGCGAPVSAASAASPGLLHFGWEHPVAGAGGASRWTLRAVARGTRRLGGAPGRTVRTGTSPRYPGAYQASSPRRSLPLRSSGAAVWAYTGIRSTRARTCACQRRPTHAVALARPGGQAARSNASWCCSGCVSPHHRRQCCVTLLTPPPPCPPPCLLLCD